MKHARAALLVCLAAILAACCVLFAACGGKEYTVTVAEAANGTVTASQTTAEKDTVIELTAVPDKGYALSDLKVDGESVMAMVVDGKYSFTIGKDVSVEAQFAVQTYTIVYKDGNKVLTGQEPASYTVTDTVTLPVLQDKDGLTFGGWFEQASFQGEAITSFTGETGNKVFYVKWEEKMYEVSGTVQSAAYEFGGAEYDLYAIDYASLTVRYTNTETDSVYTVKPQSNGEYALSVPAGTYSVTFAYANFTSPVQTVEVTAEGVTQDTAANTALAVEEPELAGVPTAGTWTETDQMRFWSIRDGVATTTDGAGRALYFAGLSASDTFMVEATLKSTQDKSDTDKSRSLGITYAAYGAKSRDAIMMHLRDSGGGAVNRIRTWKTGAWGSINDSPSYTFDAEQEYRMTLVKADGNVWVYINGAYCARFAADDSAAEFAIQVVGGFAQVWDWKYSYNTDLIDAMTAGGTVEATQPQAGGSIAVTPSDGIVRLGDTASVSVTVEAGYKLTEFTVNGHDFFAELQEKDGVYVYSWTITEKKTYEVVATVAAKEQYTVTFSATGATLTVTADGEEIQSGDSVYEGAALVVSADLTQNYAVQSFSVTMGENPVSGALLGQSFTVSGNVTIDLVASEAVSVSGTVRSEKYSFGGQQYDLYTLDYAAMQVVYAKEGVQAKATPNASGEYTLSLASGTYTVTFEYANFVSPAQTVVVTADGVTEATTANTALVVSIPKVDASTQVGGNTITGGNGTRYDLSNEASHQVTLPKGYDADAYLVGTESTKVMYEVVLKNAVCNNDSSPKYQIGIIFQAYGPTKTRNAIFLDLTSVVNPYSGNLVRPWLNNGFVNTVLEGDIAAAANVKTADGVRLTVVRDGTEAYVFLDGTFLYRLTGLAATAGALGFQSLSTTGCTFSDYVYSYNIDLVDAMIAQASA